MTDTSDWPHQMDAIAECIRQAGRPLLLVDVAEHAKREGKREKAKAKERKKAGQKVGAKTKESTRKVSGKTKSDDARDATAAATGVSVFAGMNAFQQRVRVGQFVKRGWLVAHRKVAKATARYTVGNADWHAPIRKVNRYTEQPPEAQHARLMALSQHYAEMAQRLVGKCRKVAEDASRTLREMAGEVHGVPRLEEGAA